MLRLESVSKQYDSGMVAVDQVSLEIKAGETITLIGPSGCGKTTLLRMMNRLTEVSGGHIYLDGKEVRHWSPYELRRQIGYVIQQVGLFPHLTVGENIAYVLRITGAAKRSQRARAAELITLIGMDESYLARYPAELSGGQAQRVGFARALAADPAVILMDEPFGALDQITRLQLQDELLKLQQKLQKTVVFVTHDIQEAVKMGQRVVLLRDGRLIQAGRPAELFACPAEPFVSQFVGGGDVFKLLGLMQVRDVMAKPAVPLPAEDPFLLPHLSLADALQVMFRRGLTEMAVREPAGELAGSLKLEQIRAAMETAGSTCGIGGEMQA
jgi:osmoprotectant transport system ATP-binding protein